MNKSLLLAAIAAAVWLGGCVPVRRPVADPAYFLQPAVAVMKFENRAANPMGWSLGDGMADILVDRLVAAKRFHVVERPELNSIVRELRLQNSGVTRKQARLTPGKIKNVQYLIKGTVTDFGHVGASKGVLGGSALGVLGSSNRAVMGMTFYVVDVESGEVIHSVRLEESVRSSKTTVRASYKEVSLGGTVFFQTPLGRATTKVMGRAVKNIIARIASDRWQPKIASLGADGMVILNGGANRYVMVDQEYDVLDVGKVITDPETGDVIATRPGRTIGRMMVTEVHDRYSMAHFIGENYDAVQIGQQCRIVGPMPKVRPLPISRKPRSDKKKQSRSHTRKY